MNFIDPAVIYEMRQLHAVKTTNSRGTVTYKKAFLLGENIAILTDVTAGRTEYGKPMFELTFTRKSTPINGKNVDFAPLKHIVFNDIEVLTNICLAFNHTLVREENQSDNDFLNSIYKLFKSLIGQSCSLWISYRKVLSRDGYGRPEINDNPIMKIVEPIVIYRVEVVGYGEYAYDWSKAVFPLEGKDLIDYEKIINRYKDE